MAFEDGWASLCDGDGGGEVMINILKGPTGVDG